MDGRRPLLLFFDGNCGLCHRAVLFVLRRDPSGRFRFAPIGGRRYREAIREVERTGLPDSLLLVDATYRILTRSDAILEIGARLGGFWSTVSKVGRLIPRPIRDGVYDGIARVRGRLFRRPQESCPRVPDRWRDRFDT